LLVFVLGLWETGNGTGVFIFIEQESVCLAIISIVASSSTSLQVAGNRWQWVNPCCILQSRRVFHNVLDEMETQRSGVEA
jgi:hypothetical protein